MRCVCVWVGFWSVEGALLLLEATEIKGICCFVFSRGIVFNVSIRWTASWLKCCEFMWSKIPVAKFMHRVPKLRIYAMGKPAKEIAPTALRTNSISQWAHGIPRDSPSRVSGEPLQVFNKRPRYIIEFPVTSHSLWRDTIAVSRSCKGYRQLRDRLWLKTLLGSRTFWRYWFDGQLGCMGLM